MAGIELIGYSARAETLIKLRGDAPIDFGYVNPGLALAFNRSIELKLLPVEPILCEYCPNACWTAGKWFIQATCLRLHDVVYQASTAEKAQTVEQKHPRNPTDHGIVFCTAYEEAVLDMELARAEEDEKQRQQDGKANHRAVKAARAAEGDPLVGFDPASSSVGAPLWEEDDDSR